jgi:hypothetical protein
MFTMMFVGAPAAAAGGNGRVLMDRPGLNKRNPGGTAIFICGGDTIRLRKLKKQVNVNLY